MQRFFITFLVWATIWPNAASTTLCPKACESALSYVVFAGNATKQQCTNQLHIVSYYSCLRQYCLHKVDESYAALQKNCKTTAAIPKTADITVKVEDLVEITAKDLYKKTPLKQPVALAESLYSLSARTITSAAAQDKINIHYGHAMYGFWAVLLLASGLVKIWGFILARAATTTHTGVTSTGWTRQASRKLRQHVTIPALAGKRTAENVGWGTVPPRLQSLVIVAFIAMNLALCLSGYDVFQGNLKRPNPRKQITRLIGRRTGRLIMANLPIMWTFAMRNNILSWISGWTFATFSSFHRWIARVVMAELVAHAVAYSLLEYYSGGLSRYYAQWPQEYWWWGVVSIIAGCLASVSAIYPIRQRFYDAFLLGHIALVTLFLVGTWFHIKEQDNEFDMYFWPCVAVWVFDRVLRLGRVVALNRFITRAEIAYDRSSDMLHLDIPARPILRPHAGTYYYVYVLNNLKFWESHPFTLSAWERQHDDGARRTTLKFFIRPRDGFTGRLKDMANRSADTEGGSETPQKRSVFAVVEGPYGHTSDMSSHTSALFVMGGSGISVAMSHLQSLSEMLDEGRKVAIRTVHIVWAVRHVELATRVLNHDILPWLAERKMRSNLDITFDIYATESIEDRRPDAADASNDFELKIVGKAVESSKALAECDAPTTRIQVLENKEGAQIGVNFYTGRPHLHGICQAFAEGSSLRVEKAAIVCCGPPAMTDDVRAAVVRALQSGSNNLDFFPESFHW